MLADLETEAESPESLKAAGDKTRETLDALKKSLIKEEAPNSDKMFASKKPEADKDGEEV